MNIASKKLDMKCDGGGAEKLRRRRDWSVDDFDAVEIRRGKSTKFDGAGVYTTPSRLLNHCDVNDLFNLRVYRTYVQAYREYNYKYVPGTYKNLAISLTDVTND